MKRMMFWVIRSQRSETCSFFGRSLVSSRSKWPFLCTSLSLMNSFPGCYSPRVFETREEAEEWLFLKHTIKGRDVSHLRPMRMHRRKISKWYRV